MLLSVPCPSLRSPTNLVVVDETAPRSPKATEIYRTRRWIHSVLLLLRIPSRVRLVPESPKDLCATLPARRQTLENRASISFSRNFRPRYALSGRTLICLDRRSRSKSKGGSYHDRRYIPFNAGIRGPEKRCRTSERTRLRGVSRFRGKIRLQRKRLIMPDEYEIRSTRLTIEGPRETRARVTPCTGPHQGCHARVIGHDAPRAVSPAFLHRFYHSARLLVTLRVSFLPSHHFSLSLRPPWFFLCQFIW